MKIYTKEITVYDFEDIFDGFCVEVHNDEDKTCFYLYHKMYGIKKYMFGVEPTNNEFIVRDLIISNIENHIENYIEYYF